MQLLKLKMVQIPDGPLISQGTAQVFFRTKEEAGTALQKLYYEKELGDNVSVDYYKQKEARIIEEDRQNDPFM